MAFFKEALGVFFLAPAARALHGLEHEGTLDILDLDGEGGPIRQKMANDHDMLYTLQITLGGQDVRVIPDSGSFDLLTFGKECEICDMPDGYDASQSSTYSTTGFESEQDFGSGSAKSLESYDKMSIGSASSENQSFWKVTAADEGFAEITFGGILGVGPPSSASVIAEQDAEEAAKQVHEMKKGGANVTDLWPIVNRLKKAADKAKKNVDFLKAASIQSFSVCLKPGSGEPGVWVWKDTAVGDHAELFTKVTPTASPKSVYWSAELTDAKLSADDTYLGCKKGKCDGVVDTGTSLLVMPGDIYNSLSMRLDELLEKDPSCDNLDSLPDLEFKLGGQKFTLSPEAYVGEVDGFLPDSLRHHMPHMWERQQKLREGSDGDMPPSCGLLAMQMDEESEVGAIWILGIPFFKKYYTNFMLSDDLTQAAAMHFAEKTESCTPVDGASLTLETARIPNRMRVDASKIRVPRRPVNSLTPRRAKSLIA